MFLLIGIGVGLLLSFLAFKFWGFYLKRKKAKVLYQLMVLRYKTLRKDFKLMHQDLLKLMKALDMQSSVLAQVKQERLEDLLDAFYGVLNFQADITEKATFNRSSESAPNLGQIKAAIVSAEKEKNIVVDEILSMGEDPIVGVFILESKNKEEMPLSIYKERHQADFMKFIFGILDGPKSKKASQKSQKINKKFENFYKELKNKLKK
jgi:hypothetical protein